MYSISLGYVNVATAGTPVALTTVMTALAATMAQGPKLPTELADIHFKVHKIEFMPKNANSHVGYVGLAGTGSGGNNPVYQASGNFNKSTGVGLLAEVQPYSSSSQSKDKFCVCACNQTNSVRVCDYAVDAGANGEGFVITLTVL
jgi:hypothetical protein